ncbi:hypothetical protein NSS79_17490 [Paenibacillus sp. FSL L8-0436]|uniref:hypothetical protein n=1 Tax=Paenibacillus sp. FSL L8-0436 TaxID=2954686 RepID=UPI003158A9BD
MNIDGGYKLNDKIEVNLKDAFLTFTVNSNVFAHQSGLMWGELGIQKAIGFTTCQLMNQLSLGFLPPIIMGVLLGSIAGIT